MISEPLELESSIASELERCEGLQLLRFYVRSEISEQRRISERQSSLEVLKRGQ